jgi:parvulin-like peptidyl-prolyl isomerase
MLAHGIRIALFVLLAGSTVAAAGPRDLAARVGPDGISIAEVEREMRTALGDRQLADDERELLQAQTLGLLVNRQLVLQYLEKTKQGAGQEVIDLQVDRVTDGLKRRGITLEAQFKELGLTYTEFRRAVTWETSWPIYLAAKMTPENVEKYFKQHHREFDGTQVHAAHILLKVDRPDDAAAVQQVIDRAAALRAEIVAGKISFADAAKQHSQAPTAAEEGDIGLISRHEPMPETFSAVAFALKAGETSEPVVTSFGVHLIHMLGEEPGQRTLKEPDVEEAVREDLIRYLFMWVSEKQREGAKIEFTGALPYFDPATGKLVPAKKQ